MVKNSLLVLAALAWAAPLVAGVPSTVAHFSGAKAKCPKAHAKVAQVKPVKAKGGMVSVRTIAPRQSVPSEGSIFSIGRGSLLAP